MSEIKRHNVKRTTGKRKGQFVKKKVYEAREKLLKCVAESRKRKLEGRPDVESHIRPPKMTRIVELDTLGDQLWCGKCKTYLSLKNTLNESLQGLSSILTIFCTKCNCIYKVRTTEVDSWHKCSINSKLAFGMIDAGIGETHVNTLLCALDVPAVKASLLKRHERIVGPVIEAVAQETCLKSIQLEKELSKVHSGVQEADSGSVKECYSNENSFPLKVSYDAGWQKRGTGHCYNSLSGHGTVVGYYSGKILSYTIRNQDCRFCKCGHSKDDHDCRLNYKGSSKAMESHMAVQLINKNPLFKQENVYANVLIGDDDSSTIAAVRREALNKIFKWSDFNHTVKSLTSSLYNLKLSQNLIEYFSKCFSHAIKQNKGDPINVKSAIESIVPHAFGNHDKCGEWCEGRTIGDQYEHKNLPAKKPLTDLTLHLSLTNLFVRYANNADKIAECGSTQVNESINSIIASKCPKARHYAASESLSYRISAAVAQKNIGTSYSTIVFEKLEFGIGKETLKYSKMKDTIREQKGLHKKSIVIMRRRLQLKKYHRSKRAVINRKEGFTYESGVALNDVSELISKPLSVKPIVTDDLENCKIIIVDTETTGLSKKDEICQIAAHTIESIFIVYIIPSKPISPKASEVTGLQIIDGDLFLHNEKVQAVSAKTALRNFLNYLKDFQCPIVLLAHNGFGFDFDRIISLFHNYNLIHEFNEYVKGFADSLQIIRKLLPERRKNKQKFSVSSLATDFLPDENLDCLHNAIDDEFKENVSASIINKMAKNGINKIILQEVFQQNSENGVRFLLGEDVNGRPRITKNKKVLEKICNVLKSTN